MSSSAFPYGEGDRFTLHAYVCGSACVKTLPVEGTVTFGWVYRNRPDNCRYAVVRQPLGDYLVWDLYNAVHPAPQWGAGSVQLRIPKTRLTHTDLDAALVATLMLYEEG